MVLFLYEHKHIGGSSNPHQYTFYIGRYNYVYYHRQRKDFTKYYNTLLMASHYKQNRTHLKIKEAIAMQWLQTIRSFVINGESLL